MRKRIVKRVVPLLFNAGVASISVSATRSF
jgi:hypothetical protein